MYRVEWTQDEKQPSVVLYQGLSPDSAASHFEEGLKDCREPFSCIMLKRWNANNGKPRGEWEAVAMFKRYRK